ncbi:MAG: methyltransferase domain-containing protein [Pseudomonadota bacterium]|nr:methyltransferase domain-containing protein [Pseudomonadota bacterium]
MHSPRPLIVALATGAFALATGCRQHPPTLAADVGFLPANAATSPAQAVATVAGGGDLSPQKPAKKPQENEPQKQNQRKRTPDVVYVPTPPKVVDAMLKAAEVGKDDVLYDLGSGDGRIPITAARRWGTRGIGVEIDPQRIADARQGAKRAGVTDKVTFIEGDLFDTDLSKATVVTLYLLPSLNLRLRPKLLELEPGTRIVSHAFDMGDWAPEETIDVDGATVYRWTVPETVPAHLRATPAAAPQGGSNSSDRD